MTENERIQMVLWLFKRFVDKELNWERDQILIQNMITFVEVLEEISEKEQRLNNMFK
jgi:hypothetical protein